jgi:DNA ligase-associated metallophosphoesterase
MTDVTITIADKELVLMPERAAFWAATKTLLVADAHFGKAATFRAAGIPVPRGTTTETLRRLDAAIDRTYPERIVFLGDFLHAREGRAPETLRTINEWRASRSTIEMILVRGNHDARAGDPPQELALRCVNDPLIEGPFALAHRPRPSDSAYVLAGHVHPGARLYGAGRQHVNLPCFRFGPRVAVMPAFGEFTGLAAVDVQPGDRLFVVAGDDVIEMSTAIRSPASER